MRNQDQWIRYYEDLLAGAEKELVGFNEAVAKHGLRVFHRTAGSAEVDTTDSNRKMLETTVDEYRTMLAYARADDRSE